MTGRRKRERKNPEVHLLDDDGMVACNPRDREAAHRAEMDGIATSDPAGVTCKTCRQLAARLQRSRRSS